MAYESDIKLAQVESRLDDTVTSRLGAIVGIDRGTIVGDTSNNYAQATVTAVTTSRSILHHLGQRTTTDASTHNAAHLVLTNSTTITATWGTVVGPQEQVSYQLVEYGA